MIDMVMFYGKEEIVEIAGQIKTIQNTVVTMIFIPNDGAKELNVPKNIIAKKNGNEISGKFEIDEKIQTYSIPKWFLRRNRIIPLIDDNGESLAL